MLKSSLCDYSNPYILVLINNTQVDNAKDVDIVMFMYNLVEYSDSYSKASRSLWQYCKDITY